MFYKCIIIICKILQFFIVQPSLYLRTFNLPLPANIISINTISTYIPQFAALFGACLIFYLITVVYKRWLTHLAGLSACILAFAITWTFGIRDLIYPLLFLISGSLLSRLNLNAQEHNDSSGRNAAQVIANGGIAFLICLSMPIGSYEIWHSALILSFGIAMTDTWSSEIGRYYKGYTIDILSLKRIKAGRSGGISLLGTVGGLCGALLYAIVFYFESGADVVSLVQIVIWSMTGMVIDSILGSSIQAKYEINGEIRESGPTHQIISGYDGIDNNMVNLLSIAITVTIFIISKYIV